jgi:hypothetical protein
MKKEWLIKTLALGIVVLFIIPCVISSTASNAVVEKSSKTSTKAILDPLLFPVMWTENFSTFYISTPNAPNISDVYYLIDWGNGDVTDWIGPYNSNETVSISYEWDYDGIYQIIAAAKNQAGEIGRAFYNLTLFSDFKFFHPSIVWVDIIYKFTIHWEGYEYYMFDLGDGNLSGWFTGNISYKWSFPGIYELKLKAKDIYGYETPWSEPYVIAIQPLDNQPPNEPRINGKVVGRPGTYKYTFNVTDPNGDNVSYYIDWYDGTFEFWTGWYPSGEKVTIEHTYSKFGKYIVRALAKDIYGLKGPVGYLEISFQRNGQMINLLFLRFLERFTNILQIIRYVFKGRQI